MLKASILIAACKPQEETVVVELEDLLLAIKYGETWRNYAMEIVNGIGRSTNEILLQRVFKSIQKHPSISRSRLMQWYHLDARAAEMMFSTMEQRGLVIATRMGRTWVYEAAGRMISDKKSSSNR